MDLKRVLFLSLSLRIIVVAVAIGFVGFRYLLSVKVATTSPMIQAAARGTIKEVQELINKGESTSPKDKDGNTPLHFAVYNGRYPNNRKVIKLLLQNQANPRARNNYGQTPIHLIGHIDDDTSRMHMLGNMKKYGGNINAEDMQNYSVLDKIVEQYDQRGTELLIDWWGELMTKDMLESAKKIAQKNGFRDILEVLEKKAEQVEEQKIKKAWNKKTGLNGLHYAVIYGDEKQVIRMLDEEVAINEPTQDDFKLAPLHLAVLHQHDKIVELLLQKGAKVDITDAEGNTPLHLVASIPNLALQKKIAEILLKNNANINVKNNNGNTLLHILIRNNNYELVRFLAKKYTFNPRISNNLYETPIDMARNLKREKFIKLIR